MLGFLKLGWLIPGGQIPALIASVFNAIATFVRWVVEDVIDVFCHPKRLALSIVLVAAGAWFSADYFREKVRELQKQLESTTEALEEEQALNKNWQARYDAEQKRAAEAEKAREAAAEEIRHAAMQAAAEDAARKRAAAARRLRDQQGSADKAGPKEPASSGLSGFSISLPWQTK